MRCGGNMFRDKDAADLWAALQSRVGAFQPLRQVPAIIFSNFAYALSLSMIE